MKLKNIINAPITTLLGVLVIFAALFGVLFSARPISWMEATPIIGLGLTLLGLPDKPNNGTALIILLMLSLSELSCNRKQVIVEKTIIKDSTVTVINTVTDTIFEKGDSIPFLVYLECDSNYQVKPIKQVFNGRKNAKTTLVIKDNILTGFTNCDSIIKVLTQKNTVTNRLKSDLKSEVKTKIEYKTKWYHKASIVLNFILLIVCLLLLLFIYLLINSKKI